MEGDDALHVRTARDRAYDREVGGTGWLVAVWTMVMGPFAVDAAAEGDARRTEEPWKPLWQRRCETVETATGRGFRGGD
ncbi:hypothetical protein SESBI_13766 [Sesbania bispinosa]|nr:hypothetical protein SESBI_13766 [Sesbania bispinosa]